MPTYDYRCENCGHAFEAFQSMRDAALTECPACNTAGLRRLITGGTGIIFKGSGFYVNDSRSNGKNGTAKRDAGDVGEAAKAETATTESAASGAATNSSSTTESPKTEAAKGTEQASPAEKGKKPAKEKATSAT